MMFDVFEIKHSIMDVKPQTPDERPLSMNQKKALANAIYEYSTECNERRINFHEGYSMTLIEAYTPECSEATRREYWALLVMYAYQRLVWDVVQKYNSSDVSDAINKGFETLIVCARMYDPERMTAFSTYAFPSLVNNIRAQNRQNMHLKIPDYLAKKSAIVYAYVSNPDNKYKPVETQALETGIDVEDFQILKNAIAGQNPISLDAPIDEGNVNNTASFIPSSENIEEEYIERESTNALQTKFLPTIARIYGPEYAYVCYLRTGVMNGFEKLSYHQMEDKFCEYLVTCKHMDQLSDHIPAYKPMCDRIKYIYATRGKTGVMTMLENSSQEVLFTKLLSMADKEAKEICSGEREKNKCFKATGSLSYMFQRVFPLDRNKQTTTDKTLSAKFHHELRQAGMEALATALART